MIVVATLTRSSLDMILDALEAKGYFLVCRPEGTAPGPAVDRREMHRALGMGVV